MWMTEKGCNETIEVVWSERSTNPWDTRAIKKILKKIYECGNELSQWSKKCFGSVRKELEKKKLKVAEQVALRIEDSSHMRFLESEVNMLLDKETKMWG